MGLAFHSRARPAEFAAIILALALLGVPRVALAVAAEPASREQEAANALERMARASFGNLSAAELTLVRNAPRRMLAWSSPSSNPASAANDPAKAASWGAERTIRASIIKWLLTDPEAFALVDPSGVGVAGAKISGPLDLSFLTVKLPLTIKQSSMPDGMDFSHAVLRGIDLSGSWVGPINGDAAVIKNDLTLSLGNFSGVSLFRTYIGGDLDCDAGDFNGDTPLSAVELTVAGDAHFHRGFVTDGVVDFRLAHLMRSLSFNDAHFVGKARNGLDAERARIAGTFYWVDIKTTPATVLDLENVHAGALWDNAASWPASGNLLLSGLTYGGFNGGPTTARLRLDWIHRQPRALWAQPQPYREVAGALRDSGDREGATRVMIAKENAVTTYGHLGLADHIWKYALWLTIGYGYRPLRALWWILGFVMAGAMLFRWGYGERLITPTEEGAYLTFVRTGAPPPHYPPFSSFVYSLENFLPVVDLHQGTYWRPNPRHTTVRGGGVLRRRAVPGTFPARILRWYLWLHILAGWIITPLLFAGLAGLLRE